jgi:hypothetical protein
MIERRALIRHKTFIQGRIYFNNRLSSLDCIVRDVTERGARLQVAESVAVPDAFELYLPNKDEHFRAQAEWRRGDQIGVSWTPGTAFKPKAEGGSHGEHSLASRGSSRRWRRCNAGSTICAKADRRPTAAR